MPLIEAYDTRTGKRATIPEHWLGTRLGAGYSRTPPATAPAAKTSSAKRVGETPKAPVTGEHREGGVIPDADPR